MTKAFISYSHRDKRYLERLLVHFAQLRRSGELTEWYDRELLPGDELDEAIMEQLRTSDLFIALVSPDFIASDYCYSKEMAEALALRDAGKLRIVAVIVEPSDWKRTPLSKLLVLPEDGKEVSSFVNENTAFLQVVEGIRRVIGKTPGTKTAQPEVVLDEVSVISAAPPTRFRSKKIFNDLDRAEYRDNAFAEISNYFREALQEVNRLDGINTRFDPFAPASFTASVANDNLRRVEHMTVHSGAHNHMGDIYYVQGERAGRNQSNGSFAIENDEYELFFRNHIFGFGMGADPKRRLTARDVAEILFDILIEGAGLSHG